jgi:hypothetical protein
MRTAVSIYILIPLILVPQLLLGGAMIKFDELHKTFSRKIFVPVIGDIMATRWAYEAISVEQFRSNAYEKPFFDYDMEKSQNNWYASFLIPDLRIKVDECIYAGKDPLYSEACESNLRKINTHINELAGLSGIKPWSFVTSLDYNKFNEYAGTEIKIYLDSLKAWFRNREMAVTVERDSLLRTIQDRIGEDKFLEMRDRDFNEQLADIVLNRFSTIKLYEDEDRIIQKADPVYMKPGSKFGRAHFFAPFKQIGNMRISTIIFNLFAIWLMIAFLFVTLYFNILKRFILYLESLKLPFWRKFGRDLLQI